MMVFTQVRQNYLVPAPVSVIPILRHHSFVISLASGDETLAVEECLNTND